jgi:hypothetical protein
VRRLLRLPFRPAWDRMRQFDRQGANARADIELGLFRYLARAGPVGELGKRRASKIQA